MIGEKQRRVGLYLEMTEGRKNRMFGTTVKHWRPLSGDGDWENVILDMPRDRLLTPHFPHRSWWPLASATSLAASSSVSP